MDGPTKAGTQLGLLRSGDVLHVVWAQGSPAVISDTEGGPLDAFVDLLIGTTDRGFWRTHVLARDSLSEGRAAMSLPLGNRTGSLKATVTAPGYSAQTISVGLGG